MTMRVVRTAPTSTSGFADLTGQKTDCSIHRGLSPQSIASLKCPHLHSHRHVMEKMNLTDTEQEQLLSAARKVDLDP